MSEESEDEYELELTEDNALMTGDMLGHALETGRVRRDEKLHLICDVCNELLEKEREKEAGLFHYWCPECEDEWWSIP